MTKLKELEEELYGRGEEEKLAQRIKKRVMLPERRRRIPTFWFPSRPPSPEGSRRGLKILGTVFFLILVLGGALWGFLYLGLQVREGEVEIQGPAEAEAGEELTLNLIFRNLSRQTLKETEVSILFPEGSTFLEDLTERPSPPRFVKRLEDILPGQEIKQEIRLRLWGRAGEEQKIEAVFSYRPENLRARFSARTARILKLARVPLVLLIETPEIVASGQETEFKIGFLSEAAYAFKDLWLALEYPPGFSFISVSPKPDEGESLWKLGDIDPQGRGEIVIRGRLEGEEGEFKTFLARLGARDAIVKSFKSYVESEREVKLALNPLSINAFLWGERERNIAPGERLEFSLRYKNNTAFTLRNIVVSAILESGLFLGKEQELGSSPAAKALLEFKDLRIEQGGVLDATRGAIIWNPASIPELGSLEPGESGELRFSIPTRSRPPLRDSNDKNYALRLISRIEAREVPAELAGTEVGSSDLVDFKVKSQAIFAGRTLFYTSPLQNSGPLPPKVGSRTTYTLIWEIRNFTNDLAGAEVLTSLPPNITWDGVVFPRGAQISFDASSGQVRWRIGEIKAGTGVITPALISGFRVSLIPSEADVDKSVILAKESKFNGSDVFTGEAISITLGSLSTELRDDPTSSFQEWRVIR